MIYESFAMIMAWTSRAAREWRNGQHGSGGLKSQLITYNWTRRWGYYIQIKRGRVSGIQLNDCASLSNSSRRSLCSGRSSDYTLGDGGTTGDICCMNAINVRRRCWLWHPSEPYPGKRLCFIPIGPRLCDFWLTQGSLLDSTSLCYFLHIHDKSSGLV